MGALLIFPVDRAGRASGPAQSVPGQVVVIPSRITRSRWLRREALRVAAMVGGASFVAVERAILLDHARAGIANEIAVRDAADAVSYVKALVAALDCFAREPRRSGPDDRGAA